ncbi:hypothetical protein BDZ94DRAFT_1305854 [Collybia nuda]|uniref:Uncharacterized protein n=1 Tax=Collybia nuda TaxID=64659 RepID=A0A9P5YFP4_9AGAR|nr:hypothetical protein BDZ94DRAFT_1305854 [Collybia nuda]
MSSTISDTEAPSNTAVEEATLPPRPTPHVPSIAAAIANFKPTPREVISGIAPHVFDERRRRRRRSRSPRPHPYGLHNDGAKSSPLRVSAVIMWDDEENLIYLEQAERCAEPDEPAPRTGGDVLPCICGPEPQPKRKKDKPRWRSFRILK